jgi:hypothetical protein
MRLSVRILASSSVQKDFFVVLGPGRVTTKVTASRYTHLAPGPNLVQSQAAHR